MFFGSCKKVSVSYKVFCHKIRNNLKGDYPIIFFSNICFAKPIHGETYEYVEEKKCLRNVSQFIIDIIGTCDNGSLMTHILLNEMDNSKSDFIKFSRKLAVMINSQYKWHGDYYYAFWRIYGGTYRAEMPFLDEK